MDNTPTTRHSPAPLFLLLQETAVASGKFAVLAKGSRYDITRGWDATETLADIAVALETGWHFAEALREIDPDRRLVIAQEDPDDLEKPVYLFDGYPLIFDPSWGNAAGQSFEYLHFPCTGIAVLLKTDPACQIPGRRMRTRSATLLNADGTLDNEQAETEPGATASDVTTVEALPVIFNPDGVGNCNPDPIYVGGGDAIHKVHVFSDDGDPEAVEWTFARALRYLLHFHLAAATPIGAGDLLERTEDLAAAGPATNPEVIADVFNRNMRGKCHGLAANTNLSDALTTWADAAGFHWTVKTETGEPETDGDPGMPDNVIAVFAKNAGALKPLPREALGTTVTGRDAEEVRRANVVPRMRCAYDRSDIVNAPVVVGDVQVFEVTVELVPGWEPFTKYRTYLYGMVLDNVPDDEAARRAARSFWLSCLLYAGTTQTTSVLDRQHAEHGSYADVARRWTVNEAGQCPATKYNRDLPPFNEYMPYDFGALGIEVIEYNGQSFHTRQLGTHDFVIRRRRWRPLVTRFAGQTTEQAPYVEISFDSGITWQTETRLTFDEDELSLTFTANSPAEYTPGGWAALADNMLYALIDNRFRVRVTFGLEDDRRLIAGRSGQRVKHSPLKRTVAGVFHKPTEFQYKDQGGGNSAFRQELPVPDEETCYGRFARTDQLRAWNYRGQLAKVLGDGAWSVTPDIPWISYDFGQGDLLSGVDGIGLSLATNLGAEKRYPQVVGIQYVIAQNVHQTKLIVEDARLAPEVLV